MRIYSTEISFIEVPEEIALLINVAGCNINCYGCQWKDIKNKKTFDFNCFDLTNEINKNATLITTVCFMGGEWFEDELLTMIDISNKFGLKTCLYTGKENVKNKIKQKLDFLKTGKWIEEKGGLDKETTNQIFLNVKTSEKLNYKFWKKKKND